MKHRNRFLFGSFFLWRSHGQVFQFGNPPMGKKLCYCNERKTKIYYLIKTIRKQISSYCIRIDMPEPKSQHALDDGFSTKHIPFAMLNTTIRRTIAVSTTCSTFADTEIRFTISFEYCFVQFPTKPLFC